MPALTLDGESIETLIALLTRRAERQPDQNAFTFLLDGDTRTASLTYADLDCRARAIAAALQQRFRAGDRALIAYESGLEFIATFFGCLYAGVIAVPVAPPGRRGALRFHAIAEACGAVTSFSHDERGHGRTASIGACDALPNLDIAASDVSLAADWRPPAGSRDAIAFLQFTSGSTAHPRGVVLTHDNLLRNQSAIRRAFGTTSESSVFSWLPLHHDMGLIGTVLHPIFMGIPCVLMSPAHFIERPVRWMRALSHYQSTISGGPDFAFDLCVRRTSIEERASCDLSSWKVAFNGAEPVRPDTLRRFTSAFSVAGFRAEAFHPCYGLAEATLFVAGRTQEPAPVTVRFDRELLGSGRAHPGGDGDERSQELIAYESRTEDQDLRIVRTGAGALCAPGEVGEIWISGPGIARGYWNQPDETAHTFGARVADIANSAFLRTGDLGFIHDGKLFIAGRLKDLIILRGRNLYPDDIERSADASHPVLRPGAAVAFSVDVDGAERLVLVQEVQRSYRPEVCDAVVSAVRQAVAERHDVHVDTLVLVTIGGIPKTSSGKIQRGLCKAKFLEGTLNEVARITSPTLDDLDQLAHEDLLSCSGAERRQRVMTLVRDQVSLVLGIPASLVDLSVPPARLGLDSLMSVHLQHRLERSLGIQMSSATLFQQSSLSAIGDHACELLASKGPHTRPPEPAGREFALTAGQRALWLMEQLAGTDPRGLLSRPIAMHGPLNAAAFINALRRLVKRHPALRTTIGSSNGEPMQWAHDEDNADVTFTDASGWTRQALIDSVQETVSQPMDLERGPLFRARLLRRSDREHVLVLTVHHAVADFWSVAVMLNDLEEYYSAEQAGRSERLPALDASYRDYVNRELELLRSEDIETLWAYWQRQLHGAPLVLELHGDRARPPVQTFHGATCWCEIEPAVVRELKALATTYCVTLFAVLLAAYQVLLHRLTGQTDLLIGVPVANRREAAWRGVVGYFVNLLVMRGDLTGNPTFAELLDRTKAVVAGAFAHQDLPFPTLVERLRPERNLSHAPVVQCSMAVLSDHGFNRPGIAAFAAGAPNAVMKLGDLSLTPFEVSPPVSEFDLSLTFAETGEKFTARFDYNSDLFDAETIRLLTTRWQTLLAAVASHPADPVTRAPVMTQSERDRILEAAHGNPWTIVEHATHRIFEAQVSGATKAVVADETSEWTFQQLNARGNQLARSLRRLGVGAETRVAVCVGRSIAMLVSALGVLKAGGAYVPLDPSHPAKRLAAVLDDADAPVLIVDSAADGLFPSYRGQRVWLDRSCEAFAHEDPGNLTHDIHPDQAAYVLYTSGSTGRPNGVVVSHRALSNLLGSMQRRPGLARTDRMLAVTTLAFDIAGLELFLPLTSGASLMIASQDTVTDSARLAALIASWNATVMQATPATWQMLVDGGWTGKRDMTVLCGGEALSVELAARLVNGCAAVWNMYGPTETTIWSTTGRVWAGEAGIGLGRPIENTEVFVLDSQRDTVPIGVSGEIHIGGEGLARGYLGRPDLTAERFVPHPFSTEPGRRLYCTGDRARLRADGSLEFLGRVDHQIKLRGFRIDPSEIEAVARTHPLVHQAVVAAHESRSGDKRLVVYVVGDPSSAASLREHLAAMLPDYMVPASIVFLSALPLTPNGKVDRKALPAPAPVAARAEFLARALDDGLERTIADIWRDVLCVDRVGATDNFFDLGGHSLLLNRVRTLLERSLGREIPVLDLFRHPTVAALARHLGSSPTDADDSRVSVGSDDSLQRRTDGIAGWQGGNDIAIVGMAGRLPGAPTLADFWRNLETATESITIASDEELLAAGESAGVLDDPQYVRARSRLHDVELFDAEFFGFSPRAAEIMDPQHRLFLESAWEALEDAGYSGSALPLRVGVYAGSSISTYLLFHLLPRPGLLTSVGEFEALTANDKDYLATRVSYKLDLHGPSVTVQTACSTSLVAVHIACQSLIRGECDVALAGGVTIVVPQERGYLHRPGGILSPDGHCRAFDASAAGTVFGNGLGIVVLRRLKDAVADGDRVLAVIKGSSINNDGGNKVGYTAPSVSGQAAVISEALSVAGVHPSTIGFVEAHGTGTRLGDPIEVAALSTVFAQAGVRPGSCALGSVKTNIGHLDAAAGIAGLIKVVSALGAQAIPATLHFQAPNPAIEYSTSPFFVNASLHPWPTSDHPRRACVSSFGIGGTNAHVVLEEAPPPPISTPSRPWQIVLLSARDAVALETATSNLRQFLEQGCDDLPDVAFTLQVGRRRFRSRRMLLVRNRSEALTLLSASASAPAVVHDEDRDDRRIAFMFPGQGTQYAGMAAGLYRAEAVFRDHVDRCAALLLPVLRLDIREAIFNREGPSASLLSRTEFTQPALFVVEYALAQLWMTWGIRPSAMIGHSLGEYVAACLAGVFRLEDALKIVAERARLMQAQPPGAMLAVMEPEHDVRRRLPGGVALAAVNGPRLCVVSGPLENIAAFEQLLSAQGTQTHRLRTSHAFHSAMMDDVVEPLTTFVSTVELKQPTIPFLSNVSGTWMTAADAVDHRYWGHHLRQPVRFADGLSALMALDDVVLLEVGPGRTLADLARDSVADGRHAAIHSSLGRDGDEAHHQRDLLESLGRLWLAGARIDWRGFHANERRRRVQLPTYPFRRKRYWIDPPSAAAQKHDLTPDVAPEVALDERRSVTPSLYPRPLLGTPYETATSPLEKSLAQIWENLLGIAPIGANDNFFELGGNSLLATRLASRLTETFPIEVPIRALFDASTIRELAQLIESLLIEKVDSLSEEEAARLLTGMGQSGLGG